MEFPFVKVYITIIAMETLSR